MTSNNSETPTEGEESRNEVPSFEETSNDEAPPPKPPPGRKHYDQPPASKGAQLKMDDETRHGGTPYNYGLEPEENETEADDSGSGFSLAGIFTLVVFTLLIGAIIIGWIIINDLTQKLEAVNADMSALSELVEKTGEANTEASKAVIRAELQKSLAVLEQTIAMDDPILTDEAIALKEKVLEALALLGADVVGADEEGAGNILESGAENRGTVGDDVPAVENNDTSDIHEHELLEDEIITDDATAVDYMDTNAEEEPDAIEKIIEERDIPEANIPTADEKEDIEIKNPVTEETDVKATEEPAIDSDSMDNQSADIDNTENLDSKAQEIDTEDTKIENVKDLHSVDTPAAVSGEPADEDIEDAIEPEEPDIYDPPAQETENNATSTPSDPAPDSDKPEADAHGGQINSVEGSSRMDTQDQNTDDVPKTDAEGVDETSDVDPQDSPVKELENQGTDGLTPGSNNQDALDKFQLEIQEIENNQRY